MQAKVVNVEFGVQRGAYKGTEITLSANGKNNNYFVFTNAKFHSTLEQLSSGDEVEVNMVKNGKYWNIGDIKKSGGGGGGSSKPAYTPKAEGTSGGAKKEWVPRIQDSEEYIKRRDRSIARQSSLKCAVELVSNMLTNGVYKKTITPEFITQQVRLLATNFEGYATLSDVDSAINGVATDIPPFESNDDDGTPFPG